MKKKGLTHLIATDKSLQSNMLTDKGLCTTIREHAGTLNGRIFNGIWFDGYEGAISEFMLKPQHLYITTDEKIKEGDWYLTGSNPMLPVRRTDSVSINHIGRPKIVATDNPELWGAKWSSGEYEPNTPFQSITDGVAKISFSFLKEYVEKQPKEVMLEYEAYNKHRSQDHGGNIVTCDWKLKLNSSGEVIISPVKERMYTREQVRRILGAYNMSIREGDLIPAPYVWFDKNYPQ